MRAAFLLTLLATAVLISNEACAADLPLRIKPAPTRETVPELHRQLFERFLQFLREKGAY